MFKRLLIVFLFILIAMTAGTAKEGEVYRVVLKKNGKVVEGKYVREDANTIYLLDPGGIELRFKKTLLDLEKMNQLNSIFYAPPANAVGAMAALEGEKSVPKISEMQTLPQPLSAWPVEFFHTSAQEVLAVASKIQPMVSPKKEENDPGAIILLDEIAYFFAEDGSRQERRRMVYRVLSDVAVEDWSSFEVQWSPWYQSKPQVRARVITPDSGVHWLDPTTIDDAPAQNTYEDVYTDNRLLHGPFPAVAKGAVVEQEIVIQDTRPFFSAGKVERVIFGSSVPVYYTRVIIDFPEKLNIHHKTLLLPEVQTSIKTQNGRKQIIFEKGYTAPPELSGIKSASGYAHLAHCNFYQWLLMERCCAKV